MTLDIKNVVTSGHCGRILTTILYLNPEWRDADGGSIRLFEVGRETYAIRPRVLSNSNLICFKTYLYDILRYPLDILDMSRCLKYFISVMHAHICISFNKYKYKYKYINK